jgi:hypothetical protein
LVCSVWLPSARLAILDRFDIAWLYLGPSLFIIGCKNIEVFLLFVIFSNDILSPFLSMFYLPSKCVDVIRGLLFDANDKVDTCLDPLPF